MNQSPLKLGDFFQDSDFAIVDHFCDSIEFGRIDMIKSNNPFAPRMNTYLQVETRNHQYTFHTAKGCIKYFL